MGNFKGHALPGSMFLVVGIWWAGKSSFWYATHKKKNVVLLTSRATQHRLEVIEGTAIFSFSVIGIVAEHFAADGPQLHLYDSAEHRWVHLVNWQHATMYLFFGLAGVASLTVHATGCAPLTMDRILLSLAFFTEGFLFLYHLHGRAVLDVHVHQLLLYAVFGGAATAFLEVFHRGNVLLELLRACQCLLQGSWFWQIAFVLYPTDGVAKWDLTDHSNMMFITVCYCWHFFFCLVTVAVLHCTVCWLVQSRLKRTPPMGIGLLKTTGNENESEDEI